MANTIKLLFWLHRSKQNKYGLVPLVVRLTYQNRRVDKATGHYIDPKQWVTSKQKLKGNQLTNSNTNSYIKQPVHMVW